MQHCCNKNIYLQTSNSFSATVANSDFILVPHQGIISLWGKYRNTRQNNPLNTKKKKSLLDFITQYALLCGFPKDDVKHQTTVVLYVLQVLGFQMVWQVLTSPKTMTCCWKRSIAEFPEVSSTGRWSSFGILWVLCWLLCTEVSLPDQALRKKTWERLPDLFYMKELKSGIFFF